MKMCHAHFLACIARPEQRAVLCLLLIRIHPQRLQLFRATANFFYDVLMMRWLIRTWDRGLRVLVCECVHIEIADACHGRSTSHLAAGRPAPGRTHCSPRLAGPGRASGQGRAAGVAALLAVGQASLLKKKIQLQAASRTRLVRDATTCGGPALPSPQPSGHKMEFLPTKLQ